MKWTLTGVLKYKPSKCFKLAIFRVRNGFYLGSFLHKSSLEWRFSYVLNFFFRAVFSGKSNERKPQKKSPEKWEKKSEEHKKKSISSATLNKWKTVKIFIFSIDLSQITFHRLLLRTLYWWVHLFCGIAFVKVRFICFVHLGRSLLMWAKN